MTVSAQDAHPYPIYNARFRLIVPLLDADGDPISPSSPDTELSQDLGTFADATNEATEIATSSGIVYVDLISSEMDTKSTVVRVQSTGAKTTVAVLNPRRLPIVRAGTAQAGAASTITLDASASAINDYYNGCWVNCTNNSPANVQGQARMITDYDGSTKVATIEGTWGTNPSSATTFEVLASEWWHWRLADTNAIEGVALSTHASGLMGSDLRQIAGSAVSTTTAQLGVNVVQISTDATAADNAELFFDGTGYAGGTTKLDVNVVQISGDTTSADNLESYTDGTTPQPVNATQISGDATAADNAEAFFDGTGYAGTGNTIPTVTNVTTVNGLAANTITAASIATDAITAGKIAADAIGASELAADAVAEIADGVWDEAASGHVTSGTFGQRLNLIRANTAQAGASTTITLDASASAVDDFYNNTIIFITGGTGAGQSRIISDYVGSTKVATVSAWATNPSSDSVFVILPFGSIPGASAPTAGEVADAVWDEAQSGHTTAGTFGKYLDDEISDVLHPTVSGRTLDVTTTGEAGIDWANIGGPTTTQTLSGTTVKTATDVETDTQDIQSRLPAALVGGRVDANVGAISTDATAADNAESFFDGTGYAGTANTIGWNAAWDAEVQSEVQDALDTTLADSTPADGTRPSIAQAVLMITRYLMERSVSGTTVTVKKEDGSTAVMTFTLDSTTPTSITRAS